MIEKNLTEINKVNNGSNYYHLLADKAYKTQEAFKLDDKVVKIITPDKKNAKKKNTDFLNTKLKKRTKVENVNCFIKKQERVMVRKDIKNQIHPIFTEIYTPLKNFSS